ncbi:MAG TPA: BON domain-containing protein [Burkholderiaceae bacterium]|jgi:osmotically-inducible protein OsmY|nr:BON domain-containing protein [Burkholderiaceae bacterium]
MSKLALSLVAAATVSTALTGCFPLVLGGAVVGGTSVYTDRRTSGTQLEDEAIEIKALSRNSEAIGSRGRVSVTSYNRLALITGEVTSDADRALIEKTVSRVENVRSIVNELAVVKELPTSNAGTDAIVTGKIKASLVDSKDVFAQAVKVVTERGTVYLMGRVTEREAARAAEIARGVSGVQKVVRVFEIISEAELANLNAPASK